MKGFLSSLKKLTTNDSPSNPPNSSPTPSHIQQPPTPGSSIPSLTDVPTPHSLSQRPSFVSTPSHNQQPASSPFNQAQTPSHSQTDEKAEAAKRTSKQIRAITDNVISLSATIFDHSKFINNQSMNFATAFDALYTRDLEADLGRAEMLAKSSLVDMPNLAKLSQQDISSTNSLIASNLDFCRALRSRGAERLAEHRKLALQSDERLKKLRAELNASLKAEWEAGAKLHQQDINALMSKYGARPVNAAIHQPIAITQASVIDDDDAEIETSVDPHLHDEDDLPEAITST